MTHFLVQISETSSYILNNVIGSGALFLNVRVYFNVYISNLDLLLDIYYCHLSSETIFESSYVGSAATGPDISKGSL